MSDSEASNRSDSEDEREEFDGGQQKVYATSEAEEARSGEEEISGDEEPADAENLVR